MTVHELYQAGQLSEAIEAATEQVRQNPGSFDHRWLLCELLCFAGELERVDKQLEVLTQQDPKAAAAVALFRQLIRAAVAREQFFREGRAPEILRELPEPLESYLKASVLLREGNRDQAAQLLTEADPQRTQVRGNCDGVALSDFRDLDDLLAPFGRLHASQASA
jgi:type VI secretion system protein ImpE